MTDRELLELAAKAASLYGYFDSDDQNERDEYWNPLTYDGDALRLSSALAIDVMHRFVSGLRVEALAPGGAVIVQPISSDRDCATRRVIVRAAVEIGKAMK